MTYADPQTVITLLSPQRQQIRGNLEPSSASALPRQEGYQHALVRLSGQTTPREAAVIAHRLPDKRWLISGRLAGEGFAVHSDEDRADWQRSYGDCHEFAQVRWSAAGGRITGTRSVIWRACR